jgi:hypothetical protein
MKKSILTFAFLLSLTVCAQSTGTTVIRPKTTQASTAQNTISSTNEIKQELTMINTRVYYISRKSI